MVIGIDARSLEGPRTGVGRYLINILERWGCVGGHRFVLYFKNTLPPVGIIERPCYFKEVILSRLGMKSNFYFQHFALPQRAKKDNIDVLFSPSYILPWNWKGKSVVTIHDISYEVNPDQVSFLNKIFLSKASRHSAKTADRIITITEFSKQEIIKHYGVPSEKIIVTPLGVDEKFQKLEKTDRINAVKNKYNISGKYIISVGSIFNRRHIPEVIKGFTIAAEKIENLQLLIVGKNHTYPHIDIDNTIKETNGKLKRRAIVRSDHAEDSDLVWLYNGASLCVYLSDYEGFGLPPLEAASCGTPSIVSNIPTEKEVMGDAAVFVDNNTDAKEIGEKMIQILTNDTLRQDLVKKGLEHAKKYKWKKCAEQTLKTILDLNKH